MSWFSDLTTSTPGQSPLSPRSQGRIYFMTWVLIAVMMASDQPIMTLADVFRLVGKTTTKHVGC